MIRPELAGRVALVTGGGSGIGAVTARALTGMGAMVVVADVAAGAGRSVAEAIGADAMAVHADVRDPDATADMVPAAVERFGALHAAVNAAGISSGTPTILAAMTDQTWRRVLSVNLDGVFHSMRAQLPAIVASGGGCIVNVSSIMGVVGSPGSSGYVAAKHAVVGLTRTAALEYPELGVRVNVVGPGYIDTPMLSPHTRAAPEQVAARHPMNRLGRPGRGRRDHLLPDFAGVLIRHRELPVRRRRIHGALNGRTMDEHSKYNILCVPATFLLDRLSKGGQQ